MCKLCGCTGPRACLDGEILEAKNKNIHESSNEEDSTDIQAEEPIPSVSETFTIMENLIRFTESQPDQLLGSDRVPRSNPSHAEGNDSLNEAVRQIALADLVIVNKVDLVSPEHVEQLKKEIR
uniref:CobW/HypB/UreG nucleotide-binding domain-containing protein n=1 Tax=Timema shepardi TaxID=629360 RepID=A0A7R9AT54_TIMSH|nr:unnamed protein product [Timema shepardi]